MMVEMNRVCTVTMPMMVGTCAKFVYIDSCVGDILMGLGYIISGVNFFVFCRDKHKPVEKKMGHFNKIRESSAENLGRASKVLSVVVTSMGTISFVKGVVQSLK